jgi:hypothetical protein
MNGAYDMGRDQALYEIGLIKEARPSLRVRQRPDPFISLQKKLKKVFKLKIPKFDFSKLMKRLFRNPFRIPQKQISGKTPPIKM